MTQLDHTYLDELETFGPIARSLSMCLRPTFCAEREENTLLWGDWSSIEARVLPWLANTSGAREKLDVFRRVDADPDAADVYLINAAGIDQLDLADLLARYRDGDPEADLSRQKGKVAELSLGFGGSVGALMAMAANYGLYFSEAQAEGVVQGWRDTNAWAKRFWDELKEAFTMAYENPGVEYTAGRLTYIHDCGYLGGTTYCVLPCGRILSYTNLRWREVERINRQGETYTQTVLAYRKGYSWGTAWHGILAENVTQGLAASVLRAKLRTIENDYAANATHGFFTRMHTHDEIGGEVPLVNLMPAARYLKTTMDAPEPWSEGLPLVAEVSSAWSYTKMAEELKL